MSSLLASSTFAVPRAVATGFRSTATAAACSASSAAPSAPSSPAHRDLTSAVAAGYHDFLHFARAAGHFIAAGARIAGHGIAAAAKVVGSATGITDAINCIRNPTLAGCLTAVGKLVLTASAFLDGGASLGLEAELEGGTLLAEEGLSAASDEVGTTVAEDVGSNGVKNATESCVTGGESFTAGTKVLLASGAAVPISQLKVGEKALATSTRTGKTQPETITAVLVHHDTDLYDLKIQDHGKTSVIDTTSNHLFWVPGRSRGGQWVNAGALKHGALLLTPGSDTATVFGGWIPRLRDGWMWDLTIHGGNDHDFYIDTAAAATLVHNANCSSGLSRIFTEGMNGSVSGRSITSIRSTLFDEGFTMGKARGFGYLFQNSLGEQARIMARSGGWDIRVMNQFGQLPRRIRQCRTERSASAWNSGFPITRCQKFVTR